jgi:uncharacterized protein (DUF302 family)
MQALQAKVQLPMVEAEAAVRDALSEAGFGILTEIDIAATLKAKLGIDRAPLRILGACNAELANEALKADPSAALLLPCNVVLEPDGDGATKVSVVDPRELMADPSMAELAASAASKLQSALKVLEGPQTSH